MNNQITLKYKNQEKKVQITDYKYLLNYIENVFKLDKNSYKILIVMNSDQNPLEIEIESESIFNDYKNMNNIFYS